MLTVWTVRPFTLLDIFSSAFLRYDVTNVNSSVHSFKAFKNIQGNNVDIPTLKVATVNADSHIFFFKPCSQKALKSLTDVNNNT